MDDEEALNEEEEEEEEFEELEDEERETEECEEDEGEGERDESSEDDEPPPPPPSDEEKELLFLIEFLVDNMKIFPENMNVENIDPCALQGPISMSLTFLHFPPMVINEKDIDPNRLTGGNEIQFNSGKSVIFALTESQFEEPPPVFLLITASKDMPHAYQIPKLLVGKCKIELSELFKQVFDKYDENPTKTVSKSIKDTYELIGEKNKPAGEVTLYVRLTCIGENIMTEFLKTDDKDEPLLFKNKESEKVYECKPKDRQQESLAMTYPGWKRDGDKKGCEEEPPPPTPPDPEDENYEEIFAEINGSAITLQLEKSRRRGPPKQYHVSDFCDCDIPLPHDLVAGMSDLSLSPVSEGSVELPVGKRISQVKTVGLDEANQLVFQVPPIEEMAQPGVTNTINYTVNSCQEEKKHKHKGNKFYRVIADSNPEGVLPRLPNDPDKDVFILRIIKRGRKEKGKEALQLEFKVPKEKIVPPPRIPYMIEAGVGPEGKGKSKKKKKW